jgi:guanylate kinase
MTDHPSSTHNVFRHAKTEDGKGRLFIISAPSGAGKTTLCNALLKHFPDMTISISHTTRAPRKGEQEGVDYFFITEQEFQSGIKNNQWVEWARVHDHYYGTSAKFIDNTTAAGIDILLDIDVQGARQLFKRYPESVGIFILPPSLGALRHRLESRGGDTWAVIEKRLSAAEDEMAQKDLYHHVIVNDDLQNAVEQLIAIVNTYRNR